MKTTMKVFSEYIHYYIDNEYLGLLVFEKGELSDHRGIIRKNRMKINTENLYKTMKTGLFTLLNHYLVEKKLLGDNEVQKMKADIVKKSDVNLKEASKKIITENKLGLKND